MLLRMFHRQFNYYQQYMFLTRFVRSPALKKPRHRSIVEAFSVLASGGSLILSVSLFRKNEDPTNTLQSPKDKDIQRIILQADLLFDNYYIDNLCSLLEKFCSSENTELLWRLARAFCEKGKQTHDATEQEKLFKEALEIAEKALQFETSSGSFGAHKWYAIIQNYVSVHEGTKEQLLKAPEIKKHLERALEINSMDPTTWHILGIWHYTFAELPLHYRWAARLLYATPPESTFAEALRHFERAETLQPDFYSTNHYYLSLTYDHLNMKDKALSHLIKAFTAPILSEDDKDTHEKAAHILNKKYDYTEDELSKLIEDQKP